MTTLAVAKAAGFWVKHVDEPGTVRVRGEVLEIGPNASANRVITIACAKVLSEDGISRGERCLRLFVELMGAEFEPL